MLPSVTTVLQRFKTDWAVQLEPEAIHAACEAVGYTAWRDRLLNPVITVQPTFRTETLIFVNFHL
jgi:hypothetical protein